MHVYRLFLLPDSKVNPNRQKRRTVELEERVEDRMS